MACLDAPREEWLSLLRNGACFNPFYGAIYSGEERVEFSEEGLAQVEEYMYQIFQRYLEKNSLTLPGKPGYNSAQEGIYQICYNLPGSCTSALEKVCSRYSREEIESSPTLISFCGCFSPPLTGEVGRLLTRDGVYDRACDPLCSRIETVKRVKLPSGEPDLCLADVCVINDVSLKTVNSSLPYVSFTQVCTCKERCRCIFDSSNIQGLLGKLNLNCTINQFCPGEAICLETKNGVSKPVPCQASSLSLPVPKSFYIILAIVLGVLILLGIIYVIFSKL